MPDALRRVVIESIEPEVDGGDFAVKRVVGDAVEVEADVFADGHDVLAAALRYRREEEPTWDETPMKPLPNDRWRASFVVEEPGWYRYTVIGWVDRFATWRRDLVKRLEALQDVDVELLVGAELAGATAGRARGKDRRRLTEWAEALREGGPDVEEVALDEDVAETMAAWPDRRAATSYPKELPVFVERERARFSTWYELFPRSAATTGKAHGTFKDVEARLPYVARMGFDVLYLPPIHPIGTTHRKGRNNAPKAQRGDVGSPWAIGSAEGGHKAVHPQLGTLRDFQRLVTAAERHRIEIALDLAFQCSPDHPYVREHPEWFRHRPDGSIQYAENPPKKYEDIYPIDFETSAWQELWEELKSVVGFWIGHGVRIFRVDNPHTKSFRFWEWLIAEIKRDHPDVLFLSEAFTRPKVMYRLAKLGFSQSYTYFTWRTTKRDLTEYFTELTQTRVREFFRPNLWTNTQDILTEQLQLGGRPTFVARLVLAATLGASYGIFGPSFELMENQPLTPGKEEYLDSEKYQVRHWDLETRDSLSDLIARVNRIRHDNVALQSDRSLRFHRIDNDRILAYSKSSGEGRAAEVVLTTVNLDPEHAQSGWVELPLQDFGLDEERPYQVHDLLTDARFTWHGAWNYIELNPHVIPAHVLRIRRRVRSERDFEYYL